MSDDGALTAGAVLKILARGNPQGGAGDLTWAYMLADMLDEMLQGYALVQAIDDVEQLSGLPPETEMYSGDRRCILYKDRRGDWSSSDEDYMRSYTEEEVIEGFGGLFTVHVPRPTTNVLD